jgi:hypothetical protein
MPTFIFILLTLLGWLGIRKVANPFLYDDSSRKVALDELANYLMLVGEELQCCTPARFSSLAVRSVTSSSSEFEFE